MHGSIEQLDRHSVNRLNPYPPECSDAEYEPNGSLEPE